jgi:hypothetical protein
MSTSGVFKLIINDGSQDRLLMATSMLSDRIREIRRIRCKNPAVKTNDVMPTLVDIEKTHLLFVNAHFKPFCAIGYEYQQVGPQFNMVSLGQDVTFSIPQFGDFFHDMVLNVRLEGFKATESDDKVFYCDFLGHRLMQGVKFEVNGNYLDQYDYNVLNFHYNFFLPAHKKPAWLEMIGQEVPRPAMVNHNLPTSSVSGFAGSMTDEWRQQILLLDGPQTPKAQHEVVDLWIPLLFWFNKDPRLAVPSVSIPYGQRFMHVNLAAASLICDSTLGGAFTIPTITRCQLYINNIFLNPDIHNIFIKRIGFTMIRLHLQQNQPENSNQDQIQLFKLKWPVETIYIGLQPDINQTGVTQMTDWWRYHNVETRTFPIPVAVPNPDFNTSVPPDEGVNAGVPEFALAFARVVWREASPTLDTMSIVNHGIPLYQITPATFFSQYIPYNYGDRISSPEDIGLCMITFNLYPGTYQPSGHFNLSQARETYLNWTGSTISQTNPATMYIVAVAINFLLIAEGTCVLRYNT